MFFVENHLETLVKAYGRPAPGSHQDSKPGPQVPLQKAQAREKTPLSTALQRKAQEIAREGWREVRESYRAEAAVSHERDAALDSHLEAQI